MSTDAGEKTPEDDLVWSVAMRTGAGVQIEFGPKVSDAPHSDDAKLHILGKALIGLGTRLMGSSINDDDDEWDD